MTIKAINSTAAVVANEKRPRVSPAMRFIVRQATDDENSATILADTFVSVDIDYEDRLWEKTFSESLDVLEDLYDEGVEDYKAGRVYTIG